MIHFNVKYGCIFVCGWLPPVGLIIAGFIVVLPTASEYSLSKVLVSAKNLPEGFGVPNFR